MLRQGLLIRKQQQSNGEGNVEPRKSSDRIKLSKDDEENMKRKYQRKCNIRFSHILTVVIFIYVLDFLLLQHGISKSIIREKEDEVHRCNKIRSETMSTKALELSFNITYPLPSDVTISAIRSLYKGDKLSSNFVKQVLQSSKLQLASLPSVVSVTIPHKNVGAHIAQHTSSKPTYLTIVGDTHGQFYGVMNIFAKYGFPTPNTPYIFNGDMVDNGDHSVKLLLSLLMIKLSCPDCIHFTRGNHETEILFGKRVYNEISTLFGTENNKELYDLFVQTVREIPIAAILTGSRCTALVMHGGLPKHNMTLEFIRNIKRDIDPPKDSLFEGLLWVDPHNQTGLGQGRRGVLFGPDVTESFLNRHNLCSLIRGHTYLSKGYATTHNNTIITLNSAPKRRGHTGAILQVERDMMKESLTKGIHTFDAYSFPSLQEEEWQSFGCFEE